MNNRRYFKNLALVVGLLASWTTYGHAEPISWSYNWVALTDSITTGTSGVDIETMLETQSTTGTQTIVAANLWTFSDGLPETEVDFPDDGYILTMSLLDDASLQSAVLTFGGTLQGTISNVTAELENTFDSSELQSVILGGNTYTVTIGPYIPPGSPTATEPGMIKATVRVTAGQMTSDSDPETEPVSPPTVQQTPEPTSMTLLGLGAVLCGGMGWVRRRRV